MHLQQPHSRLERRIAILDKIPLAFRRCGAVTGNRTPSAFWPPIVMGNLPSGTSSGPGSLSFFRHRTHHLHSRRKAFLSPASTGTLGRFRTTFNRTALAALPKQQIVSEKRYSPTRLPSKQRQQDCSKRPNASSLGFPGSSGHLLETRSQNRASLTQSAFEEAGRPTPTTWPGRQSGRTSPSVSTTILTQTNNY
jgi:hypothetical protein